MVIHGRVQGVFFRASCADVATRLRVSGWARNEPDGTVHAEFEGDEKSVAAIIDWCRTGPKRASVTGVDVVEQEPTGDDGFRAD